MQVAQPSRTAQRVAVRRAAATWKISSPQPCFSPEFASTSCSAPAATLSPTGILCDPRACVSTEDSGKTECGAKRFLAGFVVRGAPFALTEELAQKGVRRETVPGRSCGGRRTLCASKWIIQPRRNGSARGAGRLASGRLASRFRWKSPSRPSISSGSHSNEFARGACVLHLARRHRGFFASRLAAAASRLTSPSSSPRRRTVSAILRSSRARQPAGAPRIWRDRRPVQINARYFAGRSDGLSEVS
jgi:hypothetical protein